MANTGHSGNRNTMTKALLMPKPRLLGCHLFSLEMLDLQTAERFITCFTLWYINRFDGVFHAC